MRFFIRPFFFAASVGVSLISSAFAQSPTHIQTGRYTDVDDNPTSAQIDPLSALLTMTIPSDIESVGAAMDYVLQHSGYRLAKDDATDPDTQILYALPLPEFHRHLGPISLRDALLVLAGKSYGLVVDPVHRLISFRGVTPYSHR